MSSLWRPFSISEGPCQNVGFRGGCSQQQQHPLTSIPSSCLGNVNRTGAAAAVCRSQDIYHSCSSKRTLAAAAVGGRKVTHPGKAILAGKLDKPFVVLFKCRCIYLPGVWDAYHTSAHGHGATNNQAVNVSLLASWDIEETKSELSLPPKISVVPSQD